MKRFKVVISSLTLKQIRAQMIYIAEDSIDNAFAWEERVLVATKSIGQMPGLAIDEDASLRVGYTVHKSVFEGTYLIHYRVFAESKTIEIVNFRHGARLPLRGEP